VRLLLAIFLAGACAAQGVRSAGARTDPKRAQKALAEGREAIAQERWTVALEQLTTAILYGDNLVDALKERARVYQRLGRNEAALADLDQAARGGDATGESFAMRGQMRAAASKYAEASIRRLQPDRKQQPFTMGARGRRWLRVSWKSRYPISPKASVCDWMTQSLIRTVG
jgi:tetratricopeptide (TPR) repeat protein